MSNRNRRVSDMSESMVSAVREAASYIEQRAEAEADGPVSLKELSDHTGISPWSVCKKHAWQAPTPHGCTGRNTPNR